MHRKIVGLTSAKLVAAVVILAGLFSLGWYVWNGQDTKTDSRSNMTSQKPQEIKKTIYQHITVNGYILKYPVDDNNDQVIVEDIGNPYSPQIAYAPVRQYFFAPTDESCHKASAGLMQVDKLDTLLGSIDPTDIPDHAANLAQIKKLIDNGKAVKLGDDLYALAPRKQNEPCEELTNPKDGKLQMALFESQDIEKNWLKSLELSQ